MWALDAFLWDEIQAAASAKHPVSTYEQLREREDYARRLYKHIARKLVADAVDAELAAEVYEQQEVGHAADQG